MIGVSPNAGVKFSLSPGQAGDAPHGRDLLEEWNHEATEACLMDRAYEGDETKALVEGKHWKFVVPPKSNRKNPWVYDKELYKKRNEVERLFNRLKNFRRVATRYDKLDLIFSAFITFALIMLALRIC